MELLTVYDGLKRNRGTEREKEKIIFFESLKSPKKSKIKNHLKKIIFWIADYKRKILLIFCTCCKSVFCAFIDLLPSSPQYMGGCFTSARIPEQLQRVQCDTFHSHLLIFIPFPFKKLYPLQTLNYWDLPKINIYNTKPSMFRCLHFPPKLIENTFLMN